MNSSLDCTWINIAVFIVMCIQSLEYLFVYFFALSIRNNDT